jgi:hypothetical protein
MTQKSNPNFAPLGLASVNVDGSFTAELKKAGSIDNPLVLGGFTIEIDERPTRRGVDQILYVAFGLGWLEIEVRGEDLHVVTAHREHPHDGSEIFKMNSESGEVKRWVEYRGGE